MRPCFSAGIDMPPWADKVLVKKGHNTRAICTGILPKAEIPDQVRQAAAVAHPAAAADHPGVVHHPLN